MEMKGISLRDAMFSVSHGTIKTESQLIANAESPTKCLIKTIFKACITSKSII